MSTTSNWMWLHLTTTSFPAGWHEKTYIYILQHKSTPSLQTVHLSEMSIVYSHTVMGNLFQELRDFHNFPLTEFLPTFVTLPELTSENRHLAKEIPIENPSFLGAKMFVFGGASLKSSPRILESLTSPQSKMWETPGKPMFCFFPWKWHRDPIIMRGPWPLMSLNAGDSQEPLICLDWTSGYPVSINLPSRERSHIPPMAKETPLSSYL